MTAFSSEYIADVGDPVLVSIMIPESFQIFQSQNTAKKEVHRSPTPDTKPNQGKSRENTVDLFCFLMREVLSDRWNSLSIFSFG